MEFYPTLEECLTSVVLKEDEQERLYDQLKGLVRINPEWMRWGNGTVPQLARSLEERKSYDDLPILADALMDAGCDDEKLLGYLRGRARWALKALLEIGS